MILNLFLVFLFIYAVLVILLWLSQNSISDENYIIVTKVKKYVGIACILLVILGVFVENKSDKEEVKEKLPVAEISENKTDSTSKTVPNKTTQNRTSEDTAQSLITEIVKKSTSSADFVGVTLTKDDNSNMYSIVVYFNGKDNFTSNLIYTGYQICCKEVFKGLYTSSMGAKIKDVKINIYTKIINTATGKEIDTVVYMLSMTKENANKMNWQNIDVVDIEKAATEKFIHPALQKELK